MFLVMSPGRTVPNPPAIPPRLRNRTVQARFLPTAVRLYTYVRIYGYMHAHTHICTKSHRRTIIRRLDQGNLPLNIACIYLSITYLFIYLFCFLVNTKLVTEEGSGTKTDIKNKNPNLKNKLASKCCFVFYDVVACMR